MGKEGIRYFEEEYKYFLEKMFVSLLIDYRVKEMKRRKLIIVKEVNLFDIKSEMLLDSYMYRDYFNRCLDGRKNVVLYLFIVILRNFDEFVVKELFSGIR